MRHQTPSSSSPKTTSQQRPPFENAPNPPIPPNPIIVSLLLFFLFYLPNVSSFQRHHFLFSRFETTSRTSSTNPNCPSSDKGFPRITTCQHSSSTSQTQTTTPSDNSRIQPQSPSKPPKKQRTHRHGRQQPPNNHKQSRALEREIVHLGRIGQTQKALSLYESLKSSSSSSSSPKAVRPSTRLMNAAIDACARARPPRLRRAFSIFRNGVEQTGLIPNVFTFGALMSVCARGRDAERAMELLDSMQKQYHIHPNAVVYSTAISACERSIPPKPQLALALLRNATSDPTVQMTVIGYNTAISALARTGDWNAAVELLEDMPTHGVLPDTITYGTVMAACERAGEWEQVLRFAETLKQQNDFEMDGITLTTALKACQKLGLADRALEFLEQMKRLDATNDKPQIKKSFGKREPLRGPDDVAYCLAISACSRAARYEDGLRLLREMKTSTTRQKPSVNAYTAVISGCAEAGQYELAFRLLREMLCDDDLQPTVVTYSAVISACAVAVASATNQTERVKPMKAALQLFDDLRQTEQQQSNGIRPNIVTYNAILKVCAEGLDLAKAFEFLKELKDAGLKPTVVTFGTLMTACERVGNWKGVFQVFRMMEEEGIKPNEIVYGAAISCCRKAREPERALNLLQTMITTNLHPNTATYNTVLLSLTETNNISKALQLFQLLQSTSTSSSPNRQTYTILIRTLLANQRPQQAETFLTNMRSECGFVPDVDLYTATVTAYEKTGQPMKALQLMEKMRDIGYEFYEYGVLNEAFKNAIRLVNQVGRGFSGEEEEETQEDGK